MWEEGTHFSLVTVFLALHGVCLRRCAVASGNIWTELKTELKYTSYIYIYMKVCESEMIDEGLKPNVKFYYL